MARGKKVDIEKYLTNIEDFLKVGCSLPEACLHGAIPYTTVKDYYDKDEDVRMKIDRWMSEPILTARKSVVGDLKLNPEMALKYLERKKKDEFSPRSESSVNLNLSITSILDEIDGDTAGLPNGEA